MSSFSPLPLGQLMNLAKKRPRTEEEERAPSSPFPKRPATAATHERTNDQASPSTAPSPQTGDATARTASSAPDWTRSSFSALAFAASSTGPLFATTATASLAVPPVAATGSSSNTTTVQSFPLASSARSFFGAKGGSVAPPTRLAIEPPPAAEERSLSSSIFSQQSKNKTVTPVKIKQEGQKKVIDLDSSSSSSTSSEENHPGPDYMHLDEPSAAPTSHPAEQERDLDPPATDQDDQREIADLLEDGAQTDDRGSRSPSPASQRSSHWERDPSQYSRADDDDRDDLSDEEDNRYPSSQADSVYTYSQVSRPDDGAVEAEDDRVDDDPAQLPVDPSQGEQLGDIAEEDEEMDGQDMREQDRTEDRDDISQSADQAVDDKSTEHNVSDLSFILLRQTAKGSARLFGPVVDLARCLCSLPTGRVRRRTLLASSLPACHS